LRTPHCATIIPDRREIEDMVIEYIEDIVDLPPFHGFGSNISFKKVGWTTLFDYGLL
jgi:hypothetical protein